MMLDSTRRSVRTAFKASRQPLPPPPLRFPLSAGFTCEEPYARDVHFHIVIPMLRREDYTQLTHLAKLGLTNADVFIYLR